MKRRALAIGCLLSAVACGENTPSIPKELLQGSGCDGSYPCGPYGGQEGSVVENFAFQGVRDPRAPGASADTLETIRVGDFYDPTGSKGIKLLLLNTAALWCQACKVEHGELPELYSDREARGLRLLSLVFQDNEYDPAEPQHLQAWLDAFTPSYPTALDPEYQMKAFGPPDQQPLNIVVDARTMKVLQKTVGDQREQVWSFIDAELAE